jgi:hypothetical protein
MGISAVPEALLGTIASGSVMKEARIFHDTGGSRNYL